MQKALEPYSRSFPWPAEFAPPEQKETSEYGLSLARAIQDRYQLGGTPGPISPANRLWYNLMYQYAVGNQPKDQYVAAYRGYGQLTSKSDPQPAYNAPQITEFDRRGLTNISYDIVSPAMKLISVLKALLEEADQMIDVESTSKEAMRKKTEEKFKLYYGSRIFAPLRKQLGLEYQKYEWVPQSKAELEVYEKYHGFKLPLETGLKKILNHTFDISDWDNLFEMFKNSAIRYGFMAGRVVVNEEGAVEIVHIDPSDYFTAFTEKQPFDEPPFACHIQKVQISTIIPKLRALGATDNDIMQIAKGSWQYNGYVDSTAFDFNYTDPATGRYLWEDWFCKVMYFEVRSTDEERWRKYKKKDGKEKYARVNPVINKDGKYVYNNDNIRNTDEFDTLRNQSVYSGYYVMDSKWIYDYGRQKNVIKSSDGSASLSFFHYHIQGDSIVERWKPLLDQFQLAWLKLQAQVLNAKPDGSIIDTGVLSNIDFGFGLLNPLQLARIERETGNLFISTTAEMLKQRINPANAVVPKPGGPGEQTASWISLMQTYVDMMRDVSGITTSVEASGSGKKPELVGLMQGEMVATGNALHDIKKGLMYIKKTCAQKVIAKARLLIEFDKKSKEYYKGNIGDTFIDNILTFSDLSLNQIGIRLRSAPTEQRKATIREAMKIGMAEGRNGSRSIDIDDYIFIDKTIEDGYVELAAWYFSLAKQRNQQKEQEIAMAQQQQNAQIQIQAAQAAEQAAQQTAALVQKLETEKEIRIEVQKAALESSLERQKHLQRMAEIELEGSIEMSKGIEISGQV